MECLSRQKIERLLSNTSTQQPHRILKCIQGLYYLWQGFFNKQAADVCFISFCVNWSFNLIAAHNLLNLLQVFSWQEEPSSFSLELWTCDDKFTTGIKFAFSGFTTLHEFAELYKMRKRASLKLSSIRYSHLLRKAFSVNNSTHISKSTYMSK